MRLGRSRSSIILAEDSLAFSQGKAPQPDQDVHGCAPNSGLLHIIARHGKSVQEVSKMGGFQCQSRVKTVPCSLLTYPVPIRTTT